MKTVEELSLDGSVINTIVVPDDIDTDDKAKTFMKEILGHDRCRITRDKSYFMSIMNNIIESEANKYGFDSAISARSYAGTENKYQAFSIGFTKWSAEFWNVGESIAASVMSGKRAMPTDDELLGLLPRSSSYISEDMIRSTIPYTDDSDNQVETVTDTIVNDTETEIYTEESILTEPTDPEEITQ